MSDASSHVDLAALPKDERLSRMRHSAAHVLAEAMVELMPDAELGIGPPIDTASTTTSVCLGRWLRTISSGSKSECANRSPGKLPFVMSSLTKAEAQRTLEEPAFQARPAGGPRRGQRHPVHARELHGPLPRRARQRHG